MIFVTQLAPLSLPNLLMMIDQDLLDSDTLLEEDDLIKPDPASLRSLSCDSVHDLTCEILILHI